MNFNLPDYCAYCHRSVGTEPDLVLHQDVTGHRWCEDHWHRGQVLNWGKVHNWPTLECYPYLLPSGRDCWLSLMTLNRNDDLGYLAAAAVEFQEVA